MADSTSSSSISFGEFLLYCLIGALVLPMIFSAFIPALCAWLVSVGVFTTTGVVIPIGRGAGLDMARIVIGAAVAIALLVIGAVISRRHHG